MFCTSGHLLVFLIVLCDGLNSNDNAVLSKNNVTIHVDNKGHGKQSVQLGAAAICGLIFGIGLVVLLLAVILYWLLRIRRYRMSFMNHIKMPDSQFAPPPASPRFPFSAASGTSKSHLTDFNDTCRGYPICSDNEKPVGDSIVNKNACFTTSLYPNVSTILMNPAPSFGVKPPVLNNANDNIAYNANDLNTWNTNTDRVIYAQNANPAQMIPTQSSKYYNSYFSGDVQIDLSSSLSSSINPHAFIYPRLYNPTDEKLSRLPKPNPVSVQTAEHSKVRTAALLSQLNAFNTRNKRRLSYLLPKSKKFRHKISHPTRGRSVDLFNNSIVDKLDQPCHSPLEGYCNMNVAPDLQEFDGLHSLDNDSFLRSLETSAYYFPDNASFTHGSANAENNNPTYNSAMGIDLSLGSSLSPSVHLSQPLHVSGQNRQFRFPPPGPPVAGWALINLGNSTSSVDVTASTNKSPQRSISLIPVVTGDGMSTAPIGRKFSKVRDINPIPILSPPPEPLSKTNLKYERQSFSVPGCNSSIPRRRVSRGPGTIQSPYEQLSTKYFEPPSSDVPKRNSESWNNSLNCSAECQPDSGFQDCSAGPLIEYQSPRNLSVVPQQVSPEFHDIVTNSMSSSDAGPSSTDSTTAMLSAALSSEQRFTFFSEESMSKESQPICHSPSYPNVCLSSSLEHPNANLPQTNVSPSSTSKLLFKQKSENYL